MMAALAAAALNSRPLPVAPLETSRPTCTSSSRFRVVRLYRGFHQRTDSTTGPKGSEVSAAGLAATAEADPLTAATWAPSAPCRHSNPADRGRSSRVALGDQAGQELGLVLQVVNVRL
jgi:hypothetical protein